MGSVGKVRLRSARAGGRRPGDGTRILVDRVWPRGVRKEALEHDLWLRDVGPSDELRTWFGHEVERWPEFVRRYRAELEAPERAALVEQVVDLARRGPVTLLFGSRDTEHNQAVVLRDLVLEHLRVEGA